MSRDLTIPAPIFPGPWDRRSQIPRRKIADKKRLHFPWGSAIIWATQDSYIGNTTASQAVKAGSTPVSCSIKSRSAIGRAVLLTVNGAYPCRYAPFFHTNIRYGKAAAPPGSHCLPSGLGGRSPPLQRPEIFAAVIRWHRPCRVVRRAANQNKMIAGGDHSIT